MPGVDVDSTTCEPNRQDRAKKRYAAGERLRDGDERTRLLGGFGNLVSHISDLVKIKEVEGVMPPPGDGGDTI